MSVNELVLGWLINTSAKDLNFELQLGRADKETILAALEKIEGQAGHKTREKALRAQLAKLSKDTVVDATVAAEQVVEMERLQEVAIHTEQQTREQLIAQCHEIIGRIQGVNMMVKFGDVTNLVWLKEIKEKKIYKDVPGLGTWEKFCNNAGLDRSTVDQNLLNLAAFGEDFLVTVTKMKVGHRDLRKLRQLSHDGRLAIDGDTVVIGEETISLNNREDLQAAIEDLIDEKNRQIEDQAADLKAKDRIIDSKEQVINRQEREIAKHENRAQKHGFRPGEEAFLQDMENARIAFDGFLIKFDPDLKPLPDDATKRMEAAYMQTIGYFRRVIGAYFDTASDRYGDAELDDDWTPPNLRVASSTED